MVSSDNAKIRHTVVFSVKHPKNSAEEQDFLTAAKKLAAIPGVEKFECLKQISPKNAFDFGLSMEFADEHSYQAYTNHPSHQAFVKERWLVEVAEFMEIDYQVIP
ncbi:Dabb family protein [Rhodocytophaga aerolata]|uniref:Dabb family protein n=1 Tax=Rhodocytophaga aerolata TaxID=455078 RepID=A0ABT8RA64_9BACT|nr:Dabb family protein [Rhodocytophaga aerolata]MDO1448950.1 Dabb family protein [Rhodocytophaga aerolata]